MKKIGVFGCKSTTIFLLEFLRKTIGIACVVTITPKSGEKNQVADYVDVSKYCEKHKRIYGDKCRPIWCKSCKHLKLYQITPTEKSRKMTPNFDKKNSLQTACIF